MNKEQKAEVVEKLTEQLKASEAIFAIDYRGISVPQAAELRSGLREAGAEFRIVKNRLTLRAADAAGTTDIKDHLVGPTALTLVDGDVALAAKTIRRLGDEWELLEYKGGIMDGAALDPDSFTAIAKLPGRDQLNAQFAGIVASPLTGLVRGLGSMVQGLALQLQAIADQGLVTGEAPPAEPEAPAAEEGDPDPEPEASPEEEPSQESAPEGEDAGQGVPETGEGDADPGDAQDESGAPADEGSDEQASDGNDVDKDKEDAS
jgi:large subunit ribosomal protein L10